MDFISVCLLLGFVCVLAIVMGLVFVVFTSEQYPTIREYKEESTFLDPISMKQMNFPSITDYPSCTLSVIVPAYNEEDRLRPMLDECISYLSEREKKQNFSYEVIIVDDGSRDKTSQVGIEYSKQYTADKVRVLTLCKNRGKGGAVREGMLRSRGELVLFADADGASKFSDYRKLENSILKLCSDVNNISDSFGIVCGSRAHLEKDSVATRSFFRTLLMYGFHLLVWLFSVRNVKDTQCGFKLLTRRSARIIFKSLHIERWAFDVEMLYIAQSLGIPIEEVAVEWTEIEGSKITPVISWIQMGVDLVLIWLRYTIGAWKIKGEDTKEHREKLKNTPTKN